MSRDERGIKPVYFSLRLDDISVTESVAHRGTKLRALSAPWICEMADGSMHMERSGRKLVAAHGGSLPNLS